METKLLKRCLSGLNKLVGKPNFPILNNVTVSIKNNYFVLKGTSLDQYVTFKIPFYGEMVEACVPLVSLKKLVDKTSAKELNWFEVENMALKVKAGKTEVIIQGVDPVDFPDKHAFSPRVKEEFNGEFLIPFFEKTIGEVSNDKDREHLQYVNLEQDENNVLYAVSSNGHRLHLYQDEMNFRWLDKNVLLPEKAVKFFLDFKPKGNMEVKMADGMSDGMMEMNYETSDNVMIGLYTRTSKLQYPDWKRIFPLHGSEHCFINKDELITAHKELLGLDCEQVKTEFNGKLKLVSTNPEIGEIKTEVEPNSNSLDVMLCYNIKYMIDALANADRDMVEIYSNSPNVPITIKANKFKALVMPIRQ